MKKSLLVIATLAAMVGGVHAANVSLYGAADLGLSYQYSKVKGGDTTHSYGLNSGNLGASKFGLKGEEDLGNGYAVGFKLENGFDADTGKLGQDGRLFGREAALTMKTPFGSLAAGRMGSLTSGAGTYDIFQAYADVFDGGVNTIGTGYWQGTGRYDNMLTYATPDMAGMKVYAQYGFANDGAEAADNERNNDRYWGVGATYDNGPLSLVAVVDSVMPKHTTDDVNQDSYAVSLGGSYDFGSVKPFVGMQYGEHMNTFGFVNSDIYDGITKTYVERGYALSLGAQVDLPVGSLQAGLFYAHTSDGSFSAKRGAVTRTVLVDKSDVYGVGLVHSYPLSKRTTLYSGLGYSYFKGEGHYTGSNTEGVFKKQQGEALLGVNHTF